VREREGVDAHKHPCQHTHARRCPHTRNRTQSRTLTHAQTYAQTHVHWQAVPNQSTVARTPMIVARTEGHKPDADEIGLQRIGVEFNVPMAGLSGPEMNAIGSNVHWLQARGFKTILERNLPDKDTRLEPTTTGAPALHQQTLAVPHPATIPLRHHTLGYIWGALGVAVGIGWASSKSSWTPAIIPTSNINITTYTLVPGTPIREWSVERCAIEWRRRCQQLTTVEDSMQLLECGSHGSLK
jgi:hypothetical protein